MNKVVCKNILTKSKLPGNDYVFNPYIGCTHACRYCYAHYMRKFTSHENDEWGTFIDYKENAIAKLKEEVKKLRKSDKIFLGSVTDVYQPVERKLEITRDALKIFLEYECNISILTKSDLVLRDVDIISKFKNIEVGFSLGCSEDSIVLVTEPGAVNATRRIKALENLNEVDIKTYAFISPIIPYLSKLEYTFKNVSNHIQYIMGEVINLKATNINILKKSLVEIYGKDKANKILDLCISQNYLDDVKEEFNRLCIKYNVKNNGFYTHNK